MQVGDLAKYRNTGTVGKVVEIKDEETVTWVLLDTTNLYYDAATLDPARPEEYRETTDREKGLKDQLAEVNRLREQIEEMQESVSKITPSGAG